MGKSRPRLILIIRLARRKLLPHKEAYAALASADQVQRLPCRQIVAEMYKPTDFI
jgi:hypothetical protein